MITIETIPAPKTAMFYEILCAKGGRILDIFQNPDGSWNVKYSCDSECQKAIQDFVYEREIIEKKNDHWFKRFLRRLFLA